MCFMFIPMVDKVEKNDHFVFCQQKMKLCTLNAKVINRQIVDNFLFLWLSNCYKKNVDFSHRVTRS